jgi:hypothetical protein
VHTPGSKLKGTSAVVQTCGSVLKGTFADRLFRVEKYFLVEQRHFSVSKSGFTAVQVCKK